MSTDAYTEAVPPESANAHAGLSSDVVERKRAFTSSDIRFSEEDAAWRPIPGWASFFLKFGFAWQANGSTSRRIVVISMPCDSAAAGLIALGAMRRVLEINEGNDTSAHFERIKALAAKRVEESFLHHKSWKGRFAVEIIDRNGMVWVRKERSKTADRLTITPRDANDWRFDHEAPVQALGGSALPYEEFYAGLIPGAEKPLATNLRLSDSRICLVGRAGGESASRRILSGVRFQTCGRTSDLSQLLTIQAWSPGLISRVTFFNARTRKLDRATGIPQLVVADGDQAFLKVIEADTFRFADVVGVIHRTMERNRLEAVGNKMVDLRQWYSPDAQMPASNPPPNGIAVSMIRRN